MAIVGSSSPDLMSPSLVDHLVEVPGSAYVHSTAGLPHASARVSLRSLGCNYALGSYRPMTLRRDGWSVRRSAS